ncbi:MAG: hypothetical protein K0Q87_1355 [Neobacillus sp.]|jgi:hypothetical protein|nr:hypothetical protein [Neobacillus sp.]
MEIKELKDLEVIKNALENYISGTENNINSLSSETGSELMISTLQEQVNRGKHLLKEITDQFANSLKEKAKQALDNEEIVPISQEDLMEQMFPNMSKADIEEYGMDRFCNKDDY